LRAAAGVLRSDLASVTPAPDLGGRAAEEEGIFAVDLVHRLPRISFRRQVSVALALVALLALVVPGSVGAAKPTGPLGRFKNIVVIYEENHSFDNLYGLWGSVSGQATDGLATADAPHTLQKAQDGTTYQCLLQMDYNLRTVNQAGQAPQVHGPLAATCPNSTGGTESVTRGDGTIVTYDSHFTNGPFKIDDYIAPTDVTCPPRNNLFGFSNGIDKRNTVAGATAGGCTRDQVHRFYQEQYAIDGGAQDHYVTGSDSAGTVMGYYDTTALPIYQYLHSKGAPNYVIADRFFQSAFGGSFLNHQFLIAATPPGFNGTHSVLDASGMPRGASTSVSPFAGPYPLYASASSTLVDGNTTQACGQPTTVAGLACGNYGVNTLNPFYQPTGSFAAKLPPIDDTQTPMNIGDLLSDHGVSWAYYGGGWDNAAGIVDGRGYTNQKNGTVGGSCSDPNSTPAAADGNGQNSGWPYCPDFSYQAHHYPFAYFARYAPGQPDRDTHLQDEQDFLWAAQNGKLPSVSFVKPVGVENEHPGYASEPNGSNHLLNLIQAVMTGPQAGNTLIVVTYDEFGGSWDHVPPPSASNNVAAHDQWGPGTRIPALILGRSLTKSGVDHTYYDTLSIMATIEDQWGLGRLPGNLRDGSVNDLANAVSAGLKP
jgi:acid phosphatase